MLRFDTEAEALEWMRQNPELEIPKDTVASCVRLQRTHPRDSVFIRIDLFVVKPCDWEIAEVCVRCHELEEAWKYPFVMNPGRSMWELLPLTMGNTLERRVTPNMPPEEVERVLNDLHRIYRPKTIFSTMIESPVGPCYAHIVLVHGVAPQNLVYKGSIVRVRPAFPRLVDLFNGTYNDPSKD